MIQSTSFLKIALATLLIFFAGCEKKASTTAAPQSSAPEVASVLDPVFAVDDEYSPLGYNIPDDDALGIDVGFDVTEDVRIQKIAFEIRITHPHIGDLQVTLTSPNGTAVVLHNQTGGSTDNIYTTYGFQGVSSSALANLEGEFSAGSWNLNVADLAGQDLGTLILLESQ